MTDHPYDELLLDNGAKLIFTPCPGTKKASLDDSVKTLKLAGAQAIISIMYDKEMAANNAQQLPAICLANQMTWLQWPVSDEAGPNDEFKEAYQASIGHVLEIIQHGGSVAVHCKGGSGRTGLAIALILKALGMTEHKIIEQVQVLRPKALTHPVQLAYFQDF